MSHPLENYAKKHDIWLQAPPHENIERDEEGVPLKDPGMKAVPIVRIGLWMTFLVFPIIGLLFFGLYYNYGGVFLRPHGWWCYGISSGFFFGWVLFGWSIVDEANWIGVDDWRAWLYKYGRLSK